MHDEQPEVRITLRLPEDLRDALTKKASENARSMNGEILARLLVSIISEKERAENPETEKQIDSLYRVQGELIESLHRELENYEQTIKMQEKFTKVVASSFRESIVAIKMASQGDFSRLRAILSMAKRNPDTINSLVELANGKDSW